MIWHLHNIEIYHSWKWIVHSYCLHFKTIPQKISWQNLISKSNGSKYSCAKTLNKNQIANIDETPITVSRIIFSHRIQILSCRYSFDRSINVVIFDSWVFLPRFMYFFFFYRHIFEKIVFTLNNKEYHGQEQCFCLKNKRKLNFCLREKKHLNARENMESGYSIEVLWNNKFLDIIECKFLSFLFVLVSIQFKKKCNVKEAVNWRIRVTRCSRC